MKKLTTPISEEDARVFKVGDQVLISGYIYCGRDAVLPKVCALVESGEIKNTDIHLKGSVIFHTAVSQAGVGPTTSGKVEIEGSFETLSKAGAKMHIGKGAIKEETVKYWMSRTQFMRSYRRLLHFWVITHWKRGWLLSLNWEWKLCTNLR